MNNKLTEIVFILDKSGSMCGLEEDTIGGFNSLIEKQKKEEGEAYVSCVLFNHSSKVIYDRVSLDKIQPMTDKQYYVGGSTALLDAVGGAINHLQKVHKYAREEERPAKTLMVIVTDGFENSSCEYSYDKVKTMITKAQKENDWEFLFLGANIDAVSEADRFGIKANRAVRYQCDSEGIEKNFNVVSDACCSIRACASISDDWAEEIEEDYKKRGK